MKIIDCLQYFDEDMLLDVRFNTLNEHVSQFIVFLVSFVCGRGPCMSDHLEVCVCVHRILSAENRRQRNAKPNKRLTNA